MSSQHLCSNPDYAHIIAAWLTLKLIEFRVHPWGNEEHIYPDPDLGLSTASSAITQATLEEIEDPAIRFRNDKPKLYIVFAGNGNLNLPKLLTTLPKFEDKMSQWQQISVRQAGFKNVLGASKTNNWSTDTKNDVKSIIDRILVQNKTTDIVCLGFSLGGLGASIFARECAVRLPAVKFTYVGYRTLNSEIDAAVSIPLNYKFGTALSKVVRTVCHSARTNEDNYSKSVKANLEAAYTTLATYHRTPITPLEVGIISGIKKAEDFLAGGTKVLEEWLLDAHIVCLIDEIDGSHVDFRPDVVQTVVKRLNETNSTTGCISVRPDPPR